MAIEPPLKKCPIHIPDEIVLSNIIPNLPPKSAYRFKCVSKSWLSAITNLIGHLPRNHGVLVHSDSHLYTVLNYASFKGRATTTTTTAAVAADGYNGDQGLKRSKMGWPHPRSVIPLETSNGLVCSMISRDSVTIWNPITRTPREIALSEHIGSCSEDVKGGNSVWAFGYVPSLRDYKMIHACPVTTEVFSLKRDGNWREIPTSRLLQLYRNSDSDSAVVLPDGKTHWLLRRYDGNKRCIAAVILAFDLATEVFLEAAVPEPLNGDDGNPRYLRTHACIGTMNESLCVASVDSMKGLHLWVLGRYGDWTSWTKVLSHVVFPVAEKLRFFTSCGSENGIGRILVHLGGQVWFLYYDNVNTRFSLVGHHTHHTRKYVETSASPFVE